MNARIRYLYHSGFAIQTTGHFLIFDYWKQQPGGKGLESGVVDPAALKDFDVIVFASHKHRDHYNRNIPDWKDTIPNLRLILSDDIPAVPDAIMIGPGKKLSQSDFSVETLASNDEGVAFIVETDGLTIYHAGDLNWWHWEGEPEEYNSGMAESYKSQISLMSGRKIDIAFVPVDPRLGEQYAWGINHLMSCVDVSRVVPMHYGKKNSVVDRLLQDETSEGYRDRIIRLPERGAEAEI